MPRKRTALVATLLALLHCQSVDPLGGTPPKGDASSDTAVPVLTDASSVLADRVDAPSDGGSFVDAAPPFRCPARTSAPKPADVRVELLASGLKSPWSLAFLPNGDLLFTERDGALRLFRKNGTLEPIPISGGPATVNAGQSGYLGLALHPDFAQKPFVYLAYARTFPGDLSPVGIRISRFRWDRESLTDETPILDGPHDDDTVGNVGGRIAFGPDKALYATLGDRGNNDAVQRLDNLNGKIVRVADDGTTPNDNPFFSTPGARREIFTYGHRNPQGLAFRPGTLELYSSEHGAVDGDEINRIEAGKNYGFPILEKDASAPGMVSPFIELTPAIAPSGATFYASATIAEWCGDLFVAGLIGTKILRVHLPMSGPPVLESVFQYEFGRIRDVAQGPDGYLYFIEDHPTDGKLRRAVPN
jgi:glucose/arabinose dehydrogenase